MKRGKKNELTLKKIKREIRCLNEHIEESLDIIHQTLQALQEAVQEQQEEGVDE